MATDVMSGGSPEDISQLLCGKIDNSCAWKGRAMALIAALMQALVYMRDQKEIMLDVEIIRDHLVLDKIVALGKRRDLPVHVLKAVKGYMLSIPGYSETAAKQSDSTLEQHGYLQMKLTQPLEIMEYYIDLEVIKAMLKIMKNKSKAL